jgi:hypothetical protein
VRVTISGVSKGDELAVVVNEEAVVEEFRLLFDTRNRPSGPHSGRDFHALLGPIVWLFYVFSEVVRYTRVR